MREIEAQLWGGGGGSSRHNDERGATTNGRRVRDGPRLRPRGPGPFSGYRRGAGPTHRYPRQPRGAPPERVLPRRGQDLLLPGESITIRRVPTRSSSGVRPCSSSPSWTDSTIRGSLSASSGMWQRKAEVGRRAARPRRNPRRQVHPGYIPALVAPRRISRLGLAPRPASSEGRGAADKCTGERRRTT